MEIKTSDDISFTQPKNKKWVSVDSLLELDIYRELCNEFFQIKLNNDEVCELVECLLKRKLKGSDDE